jgi:acetyl esterase
MKRIVLLSLVIASCMLLLNCGSGTNTNVSEDSPPDSIVFKQTPQGDLQMYFHYPDDWKAGDSRPAIVFFFGGGWRNGTVEQFRFQAEYLASRGIVCARADYRVLSRHETGPDKCVEDGKSAVRWIRENAEKLGVDPDKIVSSGGSAGGHVAFCTSVTDGLEAENEDPSISSRPNLLVLYNPVVSTLSDRHTERIGSEEMALKISPNDNLDEDVPPMIVFFGSEDGLLEPAFKTAELSEDLHLDFSLWIAEGQAHGFFNKSPWLESTTYLTDQFLTETGYLKGEPTIEMADSAVLVQYQLP